MPTGNKEPGARPSVLATDLDGTFIPLPDEPQNGQDLATLADVLKRQDITLIYVTGRHFALAEEAIQNHRLPRPDWLICDVGTSIYHKQASQQFAPVEAYWQHQDHIIASLPIQTLQRQLESITGLRLQEREKQGRFKLSYYADAASLDTLVQQIQEDLDQVKAPYGVIRSVDPFTGVGLIDLLPVAVSKDYALAWWVQSNGHSRDAIVFAGDSGNDLAALTAGYRAIVVGNADRAVALQALQAHQQADWEQRLYLAQGRATSGVLEGCYWFGLIDDQAKNAPHQGANHG